MSNSAYHPIGGGTDLAEALETVERLLDYAGGRQYVEVELVVRTDSRAALRFLDPAAPGIRSVELHTTRPAIDDLAPHIPNDHRRTPDGLGVDDGNDGIWLALSPTDTAALATLAQLPAVPAEVTVDEVPLASFDPTEIPQVGSKEAAMVEWTLERWPAVPSLDLVPDAKHAAIALSINSTGLWNLTPAPPRYNLYIVTRASPTHTPHATLAAQAVNRQVTGPPEGY
ncbi:hypothetical protein FB561_2961 [Kribbella amoyensis]|uniref:Uncharacterized protein n=1 Tax=Kribbella amoyensis TaxID=996641 RepID=A0A561BSH0_9ACTN|nr:hypothetical protein [Kribbella amoyensis]TWD81837.1 hypothetical protein FB561_2961 [Kribbella amoyensis]